MKTDWSIIAGNTEYNSNNRPVYEQKERARDKSTTTDRSLSKWKVLDLDLSPRKNCIDALYTASRTNKYVREILRNQNL